MIRESESKRETHRTKVEKSVQPFKQTKTFLETYFRDRGCSLKSSSKVHFR